MSEVVKAGSSLGIENTIKSAIISELGTLRSMADQLCHSIDAQDAQIIAERERLAAIDREYWKRSAELDEREGKVARREADVNNIRQIAANRKVEVDTAQENVRRAEAQRRDAEAKCRLAEEAKNRLEVAVETLIREKRALQARLDEVLKSTQEVAAK